LSTTLPKVYDPAATEGKIYQYWLDQGLFRAEVRPEREPFTIVIPPPNVTGNLHMGHALNNTLQDILIRWRRMQGYETLWVPGMDHAGIATQIKVEEQLAREGLSRHDLGREEFIDRVWDWKEKYGGQIINQLKRLGASCDWSRQRFTLDQGCSRAVRQVFVNLYEKGLIYRGDYIINWCPECHTALSDIEVEHEDKDGKLYYVRYPLEGGDGFLTVATTRPETILGDTAVAVHPEDTRYRDVVGKFAVLPLVGRRIPIIQDDYVDPEFGTGAVKVTPAHDPNDFTMGERHNLEKVVVIDQKAMMTEEAGRFKGMDRYQCRRAVVEELKRQGYLVKVEKHTHAAGHCYRCHTVVEPLISRQWFVRMKPLAGPAIKAVQEGRIRFIPDRFSKVYLHWMENIRDWCISRQLWWGHRIPAWYCQECGETTVALEDPRCSSCGSADLVQDPDVLDTWFSSALWPFSTLGWPDETPEMDYFYPTSVLVTGYDIIFFWVARMIFSGLQHAGEIPFRHVLIHGIVRDEQGRKMSKSLGNGVDPLEVIERYGADALRFTLSTGNAPGNDMRFYWERVEGSRNFANKIWNAARFVLMNLEGFTPSAPAGEVALEDRWILSRFNETVRAVTRFMEIYELGEAARVIYDFLWSEYCDWYIELVKPRLNRDDNPGDRQAARHTLWYVLERTLRLLHPFMPFITEEIWQSLPHEGTSIMVAPWPKFDPEKVDREAEKRMETVMGVVRSIRNIRAEMNVAPHRRVPVTLHPSSDEAAATVDQAAGLIENLGRVSHLRIERDGAVKPEQAMTAVVPGVEVFMPLKGMVDIDRELERIREEMTKVLEELKQSEQKLKNENFVTKAPAEVVEKERVRKKECEEKLSALKERLAMLEEVSA